MVNTTGSVAAVAHGWLPLWESVHPVPWLVLKEATQSPVPSLTSAVPSTETVAL